MPAPEEAMTTGNVMITGHAGAEVNAYQQSPPATHAGAG